MRIVKTSAVALAFSLALGIGAASAADAPARKHLWAHSGTHPICALLKAIFHHGQNDNVVSVSY